MRSSDSHTAKVSTDLRVLIDRIRAENKKDRISKRETSRRLAKGFIDLLAAEGVKILETGMGNSNYFCAEINGSPVAISPFGSHVEFWDKVSDGFRSLYLKRDCRWGVILFDLPKRRGIWLEGEDYDNQVLHDRELKKVSSHEVMKAERSGIAHSFIKCGEFVHLITHGPVTRPRAFLISKKGHA